MRAVADLRLTSEKGSCLISPELYNKGEKGELPVVKKRDKVIEWRNKWRMLPTKTKGGIYAGVALLIAALIGLYIFSLPPAIETTKAYANMENVWKEFRAKNPYNIQMEGLKRYDDNSYVAVISEPNAMVSEEQLSKFFKKYNCSFKTFKHKIGYDGWLRDAVVSFNDLDEDDIPDFEKKLSKLLYGTDYKAGVMDFDVIPDHVAFSSFDLNSQVTEEELRKWFIQDNEPLVNVDNQSDEQTLSSILQNDESGMNVFMSKEPGFVVWTLRRGNNETTRFLEMSRRFALDGDLVLGAIANQSKVAIIARERCVPLYELPPMRQETLRLLASTDEDELAQSYERTSMFAGKLPGGKDFAPIYLSDELWHTEYGNILNVTDQMLKSWSENGMIDYVDFGYPKPVYWTFDAGVTQELKVSQLTYNWNTAGVGYIVEDETYDVYALNRTGSLPVSYIPGESEGIAESDPVYQAEQRAYDFFSNLSSPELVKVVQYAAMYQIFTNMGITVDGTDGDEYGDSTAVVVPNELKAAADDIMQSLANFDDDDRAKIAADYGLSIVSEEDFIGNGRYRYGAPLGNYGRVVKANPTIEDLYKMLSCAEVIGALDSVSQALRPISSDSEVMGGLGEFVIDRNGADLSYNTASEEDIYNAIEMIQSKSFAIQHYNFIVGGIDVAKSKDLYLSANRTKCRTWMKCPTIVESWNLIDSVNSVGGHNLNSKVTSFRVAKDLKPGQTRTIELNGKTIIEISPKDRLTRISDPNYLRRVGRLGNSGFRGVDIPVRPKREVVGIAQRRTARGFNSADHLSIKLNSAEGHTINGKKYASFEELLKDAGASLQDGKAQFKQIEIEGLKGAGVDVDVFIDGVASRMRRGPASNIPMSRYDLAHPQVAYEGDKAVITIPIKPGEIEFGSTSTVYTAGKGGSGKTALKNVIKEGKVVFKVPKNKLQEFLNLIKEFLQKQRGYWNEYRLKMEMKRRGIMPADCEERTYLRYAMIKFVNKSEGLEHQLMMAVKHCGSKPVDCDVYAYECTA